jgi:predicted small metal-binding protein
MTKTFTCSELGGVCDQAFSGDSFPEIMQNAMPHMMSDDAHKESVMDMESRTGENKEEWMERMQSEFDEKEEE